MVTEPVKDSDTEIAFEAIGKLKTLLNMLELQTSAVGLLELVAPD